MTDLFTEDYYLRGRTSGLSLYENFRWLGSETTEMAQRIIDHLDLKRYHSVLDYGCARGYLVRALRELGISSFGIDLSAWAIENADEYARPYVTRGHELNGVQKYNWIIAKDVLEHIPDVDRTIDNLLEKTMGLFAVVPLSAVDHGPYVVEDYEKDVTHCQRLTVGTWLNKFLRPGWKAEVSFAVEGVKQNYAHFPMGNGFFVLRRTGNVSPNA